jgi:hypothetical protein
MTAIGRSQGTFASSARGDQIVFWRHSRAQRRPDGTS